MSLAARAALSYPTPLLNRIRAKPRTDRVCGAFRFGALNRLRVQQIAVQIRLLSGHQIRQPHPDQFPAIQAAGFVRVINLAPHGAENAIKNEGELVEKLGMSYIHIPVQFDNPSEADYDAFCQALEEADSNKVFVHCAANMRVSAFLYRYRTQHLSIDPDLAKQDLDKVWKPFGVWADFVTRPQTNRENN